MQRRSTNDGDSDGITPRAVDADTDEQVAKAVREVMASLRALNEVLRSLAGKPGGSS